MKFKNVSTEFLLNDLKRIELFLKKAKMKSNYMLALTLKAEIEIELLKRKYENVHP